MVKDSTQRIVVTVELEIDEDGVRDYKREKYDGNIALYLASELESGTRDIVVQKVLEIQEFGE